MFLSKRKNGIYYFWWRDDDGRRQKVSTHERRHTEALKFVSQWTRSRREHERKTSNVTLSTFTAEYLAYSKSVHAPNTTLSMASSLRALREHVGDRSMRNISERMMESFIVSKLAANSEFTAKRHYASLHSVFESAKRWKYITDNPLANVKKPKLRERHPAYFSKAEFATLMQSITSPDMRDLSVVALNLGLRLSELLSLRFTDIDFERKLVYVQNSSTFTTKSKRNRTVPMNSAAFAVLHRRFASIECELVFHRNAQRLKLHTVSHQFKKCVRRANINPALSFHSLRHAFASLLVQSGASLYTVQKLLGHSTPAVTMIYAHLGPAHFAEAVEKIAL